MHSRLLRALAVLGVVLMSGEAVAGSDVAVHGQVVEEGPLVSVRMPWDREAEGRVNGLLEETGEALRSLRARQGSTAYEEAVLVWDRLIGELDEVTARSSWDFNTSPSRPLRDRSEKTTELATRLFNHLYTLRLPYEVLRDVKDRLEAGLAWDRRAYLDDLVLAFEQNGVHLDESGKKRLHEIDGELAAIGTQFAKVLKDKEILLDLSAEDAEPLEARVLRQDETTGRQQLVLREDSFVEVMRTHPSSELRRRVYEAYFSGTGELAPRLDRMRQLREERSRLVANTSFASLEARNEGFTPEDVRFALADLLQWTEARFRGVMEDYRRLMGGQEPRAHDLVYLEEHAPTDGLDPQLLKEYFSADRTVQVLLELSGELYGLTFEPADHEGDSELRIRRFRVRDAGGKVIGKLTLDLYPRPGKYSHAACWTIRGRARHYPERTAEMGLVCNFKEKTLPGGGHGILWDDVVTAFHEYGHVLHGLLIDAEPLGAHWVPRSLVEVPSQVFENWALDPSVLDRLARHHATGSALADELRGLLYHKEQRFAARHVRTQILYALFDLEFHEKTGEEAQSIWERLSVQIFGEGFYPAGLPWFTRFGHLDGYGAKYWGYKFADLGKSQIYWSVVHRQSDLVNREVGQRLSEELLRFGGLKKLPRVAEDFTGMDLRGMPYVLETLLDYRSLRARLESMRDLPYSDAIEAIYSNLVSSGAAPAAAE